MPPGAAGARGSTSSSTPLPELRRVHERRERVGILHPAPAILGLCVEYVRPGLRADDLARPIDDEVDPPRLPVTVGLQERHGAVVIKRGG